MRTRRKPRPLTRLTAVLLVAVLLLSSEISSTLVSYAKPVEMSWEVGEAVTATLDDYGLLRLSGTGDTYGYAPAEGLLPPFYEHRADILAVEIEGGITSIAPYLFYNCENLSGSLTIPATVVEIGDCAFSGDSLETAPKFTLISNEFVNAEILDSETEPSDMPDTQTLVGEEVLPREETPIQEETPAPEETPVREETPAQEETPISEDTVPVDETDMTAEPEIPSAPESSVEPVDEASGQNSGNIIKTITRQEIGAEIFHPGQLGVFTCTPDNTSFLAAAEDGGYTEIISWTAMSFADGLENSVEYEVPVTEAGIFLPGYEETGLPFPEDAQAVSRFMGWQTEDGGILTPHSFSEQPQGSLTALWEKLPGQDDGVDELTPDEQTQQPEEAETIEPQSLSEEALESAEESLPMAVGARAGTAAGTITFDLAKGNVMLGATYSGKDSAGKAVTGTHSDDNYYIITQSDTGATENTVTFDGNGLTFKVELNGVHVSKAFDNANDSTKEGTPSKNSSIYIPAHTGNEKHVTLYLRGENTLDNICYYTLQGDTSANGTDVSSSTLKITSAEGDGSAEGSLTIDAKDKNRYACIGGTGNYSPVSGLIIAGGTITAINKGAEAAIGGGSNGYGEVTISGGHITATSEGNAPAIGGGGGGTVVGGNGKVTITGGTVIASNTSAETVKGVAIGGGGANKAAAGTAEIYITGGTVTASALNAYGFGGGYKTEETTGYAETKIQIIGGSVSGTMGADPTSDGTTPVKKTTVTLKNSGESQKNLPVDGLTLSSGTYGAAGMTTDDSGALYLWLPDGVSVTEAKAGLYTFTGSVDSGGSGTLSNTVFTFDLAQGSVELGKDGKYSGKDSTGKDVTGTHSTENYYIITQSNADTVSTENQIKFSGNQQTFQVVLDGIHIAREFKGTETDTAIDRREQNSSIYIPADKDNVKYVTLYLKGKNIVDNICYYTYHADSNLTGLNATASTLTITSNAGDGSTEGSLTIDTSKNERYSCIGGTGDKSTATGLTIAGGTIKGTNKNFEAVIGGGSNGYAEVTITGGHIIATQLQGNAPAIGSGSGSSAVGANAKITITGGHVEASNNDLGGVGVAIGAGGSDKQVGGEATVIISGGEIHADVKGGTAIGGGSSVKAEGGNATVSVSGGTIAAGSIGGGYSTVQGYASATAKVTGGSLNATMAGIPTNGSHEVYLTRATLYDSDKPAPNIAVATLSGAEDYGTEDMKTDGSGMLYLWLPADAVLTGAASGEKEFTGSVPSRSIGILKYNSSATYYTVSASPSDRYTLYTDAQCKSEFAGSITVPSGTQLSLWLRAAPIGSDYYNVTAYRTSGSGANLTLLDSQGINGLYLFTFTVTTDSRLWFATGVGEDRRLDLDLYGGDIVISQGTETDRLDISVGGELLNGYQGAFRFTSNGLPASHTLTINSGKVTAHIDRLVANAAKPVVIHGGTVQMTYSTYNNQITAIDGPAIRVDSGAALSLISGISDNSLTLTGARDQPAIGGAGDVQISNTAVNGHLNLHTESGEIAQVVAERYRYRTNSLGNKPLPYTLKLSTGTLVGYQKNSELYAPEVIHSVSGETAFTACGYSGTLNGLELSKVEIVDGNGVAILTVQEGTGLPDEVSVMRDGEVLTVDKDYTWNQETGTLTIQGSAAYGNIHVTAAAKGRISYTASDYNAPYDGQLHGISIQTTTPGAVIYYSSTQITDVSSLTEDMKKPIEITDVADSPKIVHWCIVAEDYASVFGSNTITITKAQNEWTSSLVCNSILVGGTLAPAAKSKWGEVTYTYYTYNGTQYEKLDNAPTNAGTYYVQATVADDTNYTGLTSAYVRFAIETTAIYAASGRQLSAITTLGHEVTVAANDGFTVRCSYSYTPSATDPLKILIDGNLPQGTALTILSLNENGGAVDYYYYIVNSNNLKELEFTEFTKMGSGESFAEPNANVPVTLQAQLCVDLPETNAATGTIICNLGQAGETLPNTEVTATLTNANAPSGSVTISGAKGGEGALTVPMEVIASGEGERVLVCALLKEDGSAAEITNGTNLRLGEQSPIAIRGNAAVFDLGAETADGSYTLTVSGLAAGRYKIKTDLCVVAPAEKEYPMKGSVDFKTTDSLQVADAPQYGLSVEQTDNIGRVVSAEKEAKLTFRVTYQTNRKAELSCTTQKKTDGKYVNLDSDWTVLGVPSEVSANENTTVTITVPANTSEGTYRLLFTLGDRKIPYNIIVKN